MTILDIKNLSKIYGKGHTAIKAVSDINLQIQSGGIVLIMGPSGSGKTTLLSMMGTLLRPTSGSITIQGTEVTKLNENILPQFRLKQIGFMFQSFNLISALTAEQNVMMPLLIAGTSKQEASQRARTLLDRLGMLQRATHVPKNLSGGEQQRVAVARALANEPSIILADEPTANLDSHTGLAITQLLCEIACQESRAVVIVSHDQRLQEAAKKIYTIEDGKLTNEKPGGHDVYCTTKHNNRHSM